MCVSYIRYVNVCILYLMCVYDILIYTFTNIEVHTLNTLISLLIRNCFLIIENLHHTKSILVLQTVSFQREVKPRSRWLGSVTVSRVKSDKGGVPLVSLKMLGVWGIEVTEALKGPVARRGNDGKRYQCVDTVQ